MGVMGSIGGDMSSTWFSETDRGTGAERLSAVVLWRGKSVGFGHARRVSPLRAMWLHLTSRSRLVQWVAARWFFLRHVLPYFLRDVTRLGRSASERRGKWTSSSGEGENQVGYDRQRGVVGIRSREFGPAPDGRTLVLFVVDDPASPDGIRVVEHSVPMPPAAPRPTFDPGLPKEERARLMGASRRGQQGAWQAVLENDAEYQRFMRPSGRSTSGVPQ